MRESILEKDLTRENVIDCMTALKIRKKSGSWDDYEYAKNNLIQWNDQIARWVADWIGV